MQRSVPLTYYQEWLIVLTDASVLMLTIVSPSWAYFAIQTLSSDLRLGKWKPEVSPNSSRHTPSHPRRYPATSTLR